MRPHCLLIGTKGEGTVARSPKGVVSPTAVGHQLGGRAWTHDRGQSLASATGSVTMPRPKPRDQNGRGWGGGLCPPRAACTKQVRKGGSEPGGRGPRNRSGPVPYPGHLARALSADADISGTRIWPVDASHLGN